MNIQVKISGGFVGIKKEHNEYIVYLPIGYLPSASKLDQLAINEKIKYFFELETLLYRISKRISLNSNLIFRDDHDIETEVVLREDLSALKKIKRLLSTFDSFDLMHLQYWKASSDHIDFNQLHLLFDKGVILKNNAILLDEQMSRQKRYIHGETELVKLYCFLLDQLIHLLGIDFCLCVPLKQDYQSIRTLAGLFRYDYLNSHDDFKINADESILDIFESGYKHQKLMKKLYDILCEIHQNTQVKNKKYDQYYETLELFLSPNIKANGNGEEIFGFDQFSLVWEHIAFAYFKDFHLLFNDLERTKDCDNEIGDILKISMSGVAKKRSLYPDLFFENENKYYLVDYKFVDDGFFKNSAGDKFKKDVSKQILYQIALATRYKIAENLLIYPAYLNENKQSYFDDSRAVFGNKESLFVNEQPPIGLKKIPMDFRDAIGIFFGEYQSPVKMPKNKIDSPSVVSVIQKAGEIKKVKVNNIKFNMVYCPAGEFWMGSEQGVGYDYERPRHRVKMSKGFWMGETQVTQELWQAVMGWNPSRFKGSVKLPVENMTWYDCLVFCNQISELEGFKPCYTLSQIQSDENHIKSAEVEWKGDANGYRLPTEAEWEYCAKAGTELVYSGSNSIDEVAWHSGNSSSKTHDTKTKKANAWGLYDMSGNVWEWCHDMYDDKVYQNRVNAENPVKWQNSPCTRVLRGGSYWYFADYCRVALRLGSNADDRGVNRGLRLLRFEP